MKPISTFGYLFGIVATSLAIEVGWIIAGQSLGLVIFRTILGLWLFSLVFKGKNFARLLLVGLYALGGVGGIFLLIAVGRSGAAFQMTVFLGIAAFSFCASGFLWKSSVLRALTKKNAVDTNVAV
jgi:hypothetical protein